MQNDERYTVLESAVQQVMLRAAEMDELFIDFHLKFTQKTAELRQEQKAIRTQMDGIGLALSRNGLAQEEPPRSQSPFLGVVPTGGSVDIAVSMTGGGEGMIWSQYVPTMLFSARFSLTKIREI